MINFGLDKWMIVNSWGVTSKTGLTSRPACYVIYLNREISYIGSSSDPYHRFFQHGFFETNDGKIETPWGIFDDIFCKIYYPSKFGYEAMQEKRLIRRLQPKFNTQHKRKWSGWYGKNTLSKAGLF
jgi:hypothetical protein